jgi:hypothetical protein
MGNLFGPRLIHTDMVERRRPTTAGVLLLTASRHSRPVDIYGLCGTRLINICFVEQTEVWS